MKKSYLSHCVAVITAASASLATVNLHAQTQVNEPSVEEVLVTGIRSSILNSISVKKEAQTIVEIVDAGDLASLPDASIADALGRLPGVTTVRNSGQAAQLNIRGMNGDFIQTTLNGREQATTSAETESSRWMSFDQYPAELITQAAVYKSPQASLIEGGVAATVELKTVNPLAATKDHSFGLNARLSYNDGAEDAGGDAEGNRITATYVGKFLDDTLGFSVGLSHLEQPNNFVKARASADDQLGYTAVSIDGTDYQIPRAYQWQAGGGKDVRDTIMGTVAWEPIDSLTIKADFFQTDFERDDIRHGVVIGGLSGGGGEYSNVVAPTGVLDSFDFNIVDPSFTNKTGAWIESRTEDQSSQADSSAYGINIDWAISDKATLNLDYSKSDGEKTRKDRIATMHAYNSYSSGDATWSELADQSFSFTGNGDEIPTMAITGILDLTSTDQMKLGRYEEYPHIYTDDVESLRFDFEYDLDNAVISSVVIGYRQSERSFDSKRATFLWGSRDGIWNDGVDSWCDDNVSLASDRPDVECSPKDVSSFAYVASSEGAPDHLAINIDGLADNIFGEGNYDGVQLWSRNWTFVESGALTEKTDAAYIMFNIDYQLGNIPVTGNIGVRQVKTDVKMAGVLQVVPGTGTPITDGVGETSSDYIHASFGPEYTDTLPSLNLNFSLTEADILRFGAAEVIGRPPVGQMKGGAGNWFGGDDGLEYNIWTKGSPNLDPFRAKQFDLSYEHYFEDDGGAVTVAAFYKDIDSLISAQTFNGTEAGERAEAAGYSLPTADHRWGAYQTFANTDGGYIQGLEFAFTKTFSALPSIWSGLGLTTSYSYTESEAEVGAGSLISADSNGNVPIPGLSENVWSATAFWDIEGFSTHFNVRYRDEYTLNKAIPGSVTPVIAKAYTTMDWQASYALDSGIEFILQANNLTNEANKENYGVDSALGEYSVYGRQFFVGVNFKY